MSSVLIGLVGIIAGISEKGRFTFMRSNVVLTLFVALVIGLAPAAAAQVEIEQRGNLPLGPVNPVAFDEVVALASQLLNGFWNDVFAKEGLSYQIPAGFYWYNEQLMTPCGPTSANNAFFCPADRTIWFHYDFLLGLYNDIGDYAAAHVLAHEWGHWVQYLLGIDNGGYTIFTELQADCFAGVFAAFADYNGYLDEGDIEEAVIITYNVGDPATMPWYEPGAHGTPQQRVTAFVLGFEQGLYSCNFENGIPNPPSPPNPPTPGTLSIDQAVARLVPQDPNQANADQVIGDREILLAVGMWVRGESVPGTGGQTISDDKIIELVKKWIGATLI